MLDLAYLLTLTNTLSLLNKATDVATVLVLRGMKTIIAV